LRLDSIAMSWIFETISLDLQDIVRTPGGTAHEAWLALESQFLGNAQTRGLQLDAELCTLEQGDLSVGEFCKKMKSTTDALRDLGYLVCWGDSESSLTKLLFLSHRANHGQSKDFSYPMAEPAKSFSFFSLLIFWLSQATFRRLKDSSVKDLSF
jgi:hypothetical protein